MSNMLCCYRLVLLASETLHASKRKRFLRQASSNRKRGSTVASAATASAMGSTKSCLGRPHAKIVGNIRRDMSESSMERAEARVSARQVGSPSGPLD